MLEPLPQGMHDGRLSSAESEARQDWPSKPTEDSIAKNLRHTHEFVGEVAQHQSMEASVDQHRHFVVDPIGISKPVQITEEHCHRLGSTGSDEIVFFLVAFVIAINLNFLKFIFV